MGGNDGDSPRRADEPGTNCSGSRRSRWGRGSSTTGCIASRHSLSGANADEGDDGGNGDRTYRQHRTPTIDAPALHERDGCAGYRDPLTHPADRLRRESGGRRGHAQHERIRRGVEYTTLERCHRRAKRPAHGHAAFGRKPNAHVGPRIRNATSHGDIAIAPSGHQEHEQSPSGSPLATRPVPNRPRPLISITRIRRSCRNREARRIWCCPRASPVLRT